MCLLTLTHCRPPIGDGCTTRGGGPVTRGRRAASESTPCYDRGMTGVDVDASPAAAALHEVAEGVFAWVQPDGTWWINNAGAITAVGDDGTHAGGTVDRRHVRDARADAPLPRRRPRGDRLGTDHDGRQHPPARRPHLRQQPAAAGDDDHRPRGDARRPARRHDHRRLPTGVDAGARLGPGDEAGAVDRGPRPPDDLRRDSDDRAAPPRLRRPHRPATSSPGCPRNASCSPAT